MDVVVRGHNMELTQGLKDHAQEKFGKLDKFFENIQEIRVELVKNDTRSEDKRLVAQITIFVAGSIVRAESSSKDMYASMDMVYDKLEKQLTKYKEKLKDRRDGSTRKQTLAAELNAAEAQRHKRIVRSKRFAVKPMTAEEASMQMEMLGHTFYVFRNSGSKEVNVLYSRADGNFGLIEPEF